MSVTHTAHVGCYIAVPDQSGKYPPWCFGGESYDSEGVEVPEIAIDPDDGVISLINTSSISHTYFVTVENCSAIISAQGVDILEETEKSCKRDYVTFVALVFPNQILSLAQLIPTKVPGKNPRRSLSSIRISSDIQDYVPFGNDEIHPFILTTFPLKPTLEEKSFLCTQSVGGSLTHFAHASTFNAVDFRCAVGTPVVAVFDGEVVEIRNDTDSSGVHVRNLFAWNSIMIRSHDGAWYAEYVHIKRDSFTVEIGDKVTCGQIICSSGDVGFCPEPHLHFEVHRDRQPGSVSIPIVHKDGRSAFMVDQYYA
jgi:hypothetical protein